MAEDAYRQHINNSLDKKYAFICFSFMDPETEQQVEKKVVFELFSSIAPKTCENFQQLCMGVKDQEETYGYTCKEVEGKKNMINRFVRGMYLQMGKVNRKNVGDACSIHGGEFADESFHVKHTDVGLLGMSKRSGVKHTNECQFYITLGAPLTFLDNVNVVFGRVISGMDTLSKLGDMA